MAVLSIDGVDLPNPVKFKPPNFDLHSSDTGRNELGIAQLDRVRGEIYKIELEWKRISSSDLATIKAAIRPQSFRVRFVSELGFITKTMYVSDRNIEMCMFNGDINDNTDIDKLQWNISFNLTEV